PNPGAAALERRSLAVGAIVWSETLFKKHAFRLAVWLCCVPAATLAEALPAPVAPIESALAALPGACPQLPAPLEAQALQRLTASFRARDLQPARTSHPQPDALLLQLARLAADGRDPAQYQPARVRQQLQTATAEPLHRECSDLHASHIYLEA